jgi:hypothetical protein
MTDEKIFGCPIRPTHQWGTATIIKKIFRFLDGLRPHQKARHFLAASVPVFSICPRNQTNVADSGTKDRIYREASSKFESPSQTAGQINGRIPERSGDASLRRISQKAKAWLRNLIERFKGNISLTDRFSARFLRFIVCWFPKDSCMILGKKYV